MDSAEADGEGARDEWGDADFEIPEGHPLIAPNAQSHAATADGGDGDDDWDIEMSLGKTGGARLSPGVVREPLSSIATQMETADFAGTVTRLGAGGKPVEFDWDEFAAPALPNSPNGLKNHNPSAKPSSPQDTLDNIFDWDAEEEGTTTIKLPTDWPNLVPKPAASLPSTSDFTPTATAPYTPLETITALPKLPPPASDMEEDFEADFDLPVDLSQLALRPLHQSTSRGTVGSPGDPWLDYASMSTTTHSSETSSLGFGHHASPSTSAWSGGTETDEDDYAFLDGLVVPDGMFDNENKANLSRILTTKKKTPAAPKPKHVLNLAYIENDDFLDGLVLDDSADLSPSKLNKRTTPPRASNRPPPARSASGAHSPSISPAKLRSPSRTATRNRALSPSLSGVPSPPPRGLVPGRRGATSPTPTRAAGALLTRLTISSPPPSFDRKPITPSTSAPSRQWSHGGKVNGPRPPTTKQQVVRKGSLQSLVDSVAGVFSDSDARGMSKLGFDRHLTGSRPVRPTLASSYSAVTVASTSRASYNAPTAASRARSALGMQDRDGAASDREGRGFGVLSPDLQRWIVPSTRPNTPTQNTAAVRLQGFMRPAPARPTVKNMFLNASTTSNSSVGSSWSNVAIAPSKSAPAPVRSFAAIVKSPPLPSPRVLSPISPTVFSAPKRPRTISCLANAKVTVPLPAGAVEVKRPRRPRAPSGIWGDGTELDALDDLDVDPTQERQFQVQAKGVNEGGTVKRFDDKGKGRATPISTRITDANANPNAKALLDGKVDLSKFREPDVPKKRERERKPFIALHPPSAAIGSGSALLQVPGRTSNPKRKRERGPPPPKRPNLIRNMNGVKSPKVVGDMFFNPKTLRWDGNEQILRDFDAIIASSSRPALITNLSGQGSSTPVNGQSSATTPKVVGSMLFDPIKMCWVHQLGDAFEEDPFAAIDELEKLDEEEGEGWATIKVNSPPSELGTSVGSAPGPVQRLRTEPSPARSFGRTRANTHHTQSASELESVGGSDHGSRMYSREEHERLAAGDVDQWDVSEELLRQCQEAEERHKAEVKGWILPLARRPSQSVAAVVGFRPPRGEDRGWLHDIRAVAMKAYPT